MSAQTTVYSYLLVAAGGALGAMSRYALNLGLQHGGTMPWGTLASNLLGCLVMGVIAQLIASAAWFTSAGFLSDQYRLLFAVGFCGSFTTLSALVFEVNSMMQRNELLLSFSYLFGTLLGGFACFYVGAVAVKALLTDA